MLFENPDADRFPLTYQQRMTDSLPLPQFGDTSSDATTTSSLTMGDQMVLMKHHNPPQRRQPLILRQPLIPHSMT